MEKEGRTTIRLFLLMLTLFLILPGMWYSNTFEGDLHAEETLDLSGIYWPMVGRDAFNSQEGISSDRGLQDPVERWSDQENTTSPGGVASDMTPNVKFSGIESRPIVLVGDSNTTHVILRDGNNGKTAWSIDVRKIEGRITNRLLGSLALMDTDDDGKVEVLAAISDGNSHQMVLFEPNITLTTSGYSYSDQAFFDDRVWLSTSGIIGSVISSSPMVYDISGDGVEDVIVGAGNRLFSYYGNNGTMFWYLDVGPIGETLSAPAIYPGAGPLKRIVVNSLLPGKSTMRTTVVNYEGLHLNNVTDDLTPTIIGYSHLGPIPMPSVSDVNGDGTSDIIIPYPASNGYGRVVVYTYSLVPVLSIEDIPGTFEGSVALADLNLDLKDEILLQSRTFTISSRNIMTCRRIFMDGLDWDHDVLWTREGTNLGTSPVYATPLACDLNEDSVPDAVFFSNGIIYGILSDGTSYWNLTVSGQLSTGNGLIGDLNTDGFCDIYINGHMYTQKVVDLKIKDPPGTNIYLDNTEPVDGSPVTVNCVVQNTRGTSVSDVVVRFIDLDGPGGDPIIIGHDRITLSDTAEASIIWIPGGDGDHVISVVIDPDGNISETDETNNEGENSFYVLPAFPDLTISDVIFLRGDGKRVSDDRRLVEEDPSSIIITVSNIGQKSVTGGTVRVNVNEDSPTGGPEDTPLGSVAKGMDVNISVPWTPTGVPEDEDEASFKIEAWVIPPQGVQEVSSINNNITVFTDVKSRQPVGSLYIQGQVNGSDGSPEADVRVTLTIIRTGESLGPITTGSDGMYGFDMNFIEYLDGDDVSVRASKDQMWGENSSVAYSEDITLDLPIDLTDIPTLSIFLSPEGPTGFEVVPREEITLDMVVVNDGNIQGDVQLTKEQKGNSSLTSAMILLTPSTFTLESGDSRSVKVSFSVPDSEEPGTIILIEVTGSISGDATVSRKLVYELTVVGDEQVLVQMISSSNVTLGPDDDSDTSFELYIFNRGNVPFDYQVSVSPSLEDDTEIRDGDGSLLPGDGASPYVDITLPNGTGSLTGYIFIATSGSGNIVDWEIRIERAYPDLEVVGVIGSEPTDPVLGEEIELMAGVKNLGKISISDVLCTFYEGSSIIGSRTIETDLRPDEEATISGIIWTPSGIGEHTITFKVDPFDEILETDEEDNELERSFSFYPDLSVRSVTPLDGSFKEDGPASFRVSVENEGNAPLSKGFIVRMNIDTSTGDQLISKNFDLDLDPSQDPEETVTIDLLLPKGSGNRTLFITVEPVGDDQEQDLSDNTASKGIVIEGTSSTREFTYYLPFIMILLIVLLIVGGGLYVWKFGLPSGPPPDEEGSGVPDGPEEVKVESGEIPPLEEDVPEMDITPPEDESVLEMEITVGPEEPEGPPLVAEVIEAEIEEEEVPLEDELIPEV